MADKGSSSLSNLAKHAMQSGKPQAYASKLNSQQRPEFHQDQSEFLQGRQLMEPMEFDSGQSMRMSLDMPIQNTQYKQEVSQQNLPDWTADFKSHGKEKQTKYAPPLQPMQMRTMPMTGYVPYHQPVFQAPPMVANRPELLNESDWTAEFQKRAAEMNSKEPVAEVKAQETTNIEATNHPDALAKTAGKILETVEKIENDKFKNSKFMLMMQQFRDRELHIEGDKIVQNVGNYEPAQSSFVPTLEREQVYSDNHELRNKVSTSDFDTFPNDPLPSSFEMAKLFAKNQEAIGAFSATEVAAKSWTEDFTAQSPPSNFARPIDKGKEPLSQEYIYGSNASHDLDMSPAQREMLNNGLDFDTYNEKNLYMQDGHDLENQVAEKLSLEQKPEDTWTAMQEEYSAFEDLNLQDVQMKEDSPYPFVSINPYLRASSQYLKATVKSNNLTESVLALEALVQLEPMNAQAWFDLGVKQQENENDESAIVALSKAMELNPDNLNVYLAIAVSFTNENAMSDAYNALTNWINRNPRYPNIEGPTPLSSMQRHETLVQSLLKAVSSNQGGSLDADVQVALGILFNISSEYAKAIDCFEAALSVTPNDYNLWNKLGATLANYGQAERAMDAYFAALELNPTYIRTRYNLAIACVQMGQINEAAGYLLGAIALQEENVKEVMNKSSPDLVPEMRQLETGQSDVLWKTLRMFMTSYSKMEFNLVNREDLAEACDQRNLNAFVSEFDF